MGEQQRRRKSAISEHAARRVEAAWNCVNVLRPDLHVEGRKDLARQFLDLSRDGYQPPQPVRISPAQVSEMVWRNCQCANRYCSMVLFPKEVADELNEFFKPED